jgi:hypothetical protein
VRFFLEGTQPFNATGHPARQPTIHDTRARGIRNDRRLAIYDSYLDGFVCPYIKLAEREVSDCYLCRSAFPLPYVVFAFCQKRAFRLPLASSPVPMAEKITVLPPRDPLPISSVTDEVLEALVEVGLLYPQSTGL